MIKARIRENGLAGLALWSDKGGFSRTALYLTGIPTTTAPSPATEFLLSLGYGIIQPQYIGTFDSEGIFTPENAISTVQRFRNIIARGRLYDLRGEMEFSVGNEVDLLVGHSFGTYAGIGAIIRGLQPRVAIMFAPMFEFGTQNARVGLSVDFDRHVRHISRALPLTFRMASCDLWHFFFTEQRTFHPDPDTCEAGRTTTKVIAVVGNSDPSLDAETCKNYTLQFISSYSSIMELVDFVIVHGAGHAVDSLLTESVTTKIKDLVE